MGFFRQEYWCRLSFPPAGDLPDLGIKSMSPVSSTLIDRFLITEQSGKAQNQLYTYIYPLFFLDSFPIYVITEYWIEFPVLYSKCLLVVYFIYTTVYMSISISQLSLTLPVWDLNNQPIRWILMFVFDGNIWQSSF